MPVSPPKSARETAAGKAVSGPVVLPEIPETHTVVSGGSGRELPHAAKDLVGKSFAAEIFDKSDKITVEELHSISGEISDINGNDEVAMTLGENDFQKLKNLTRTGMANAGMVLSQLLGHDIEITVPEIKLFSVDELRSTIDKPQEGRVNEKIVEVSLKLVGEMRGYLVSFFNRSSAQSIAENMMGITEGITDTKISEDVQSALNEITNIIGASVINSIADKGGLNLQIEVPELSYEKSEDFVKNLKLPSNFVLFMNTEFIASENKVVGQLAMFPDFNDLKKILAKI